MGASDRRVRQLLVEMEKRAMPYGLEPDDFGPSCRVDCNGATVCRMRSEAIPSND